MTRTTLAATVLLGLAVVASAIGVVHSKYQSRVEFARLQALSGERHALEVQWGRLRLEEAALTTHPRVEERVRRGLAMHLPRGAEVRVVMTTPPHAAPPPSQPALPAIAQVGGAHGGE